MRIPRVRFAPPTLVALTIAATGTFVVLLLVYRARSFRREADLHHKQAVAARDRWASIQRDFNARFDAAKRELAKEPPPDRRTGVPSSRWSKLRNNVHLFEHERMDMPSYGLTADYHSLLELHYRAAARTPWVILDRDPPEPSLLAFSSPLIPLIHPTPARSPLEVALEAASYPLGLADTVLGRVLLFLLFLLLCHGLVESRRKGRDKSGLGDPALSSDKVHL
jgi:hypothetical protein